MNAYARNTHKHSHSRQEITAFYVTHTIIRASTTARPLVPVLSRLSLVNILVSCVLNNHFNVIPPQDDNRFHTAESVL